MVPRVFYSFHYDGDKDRVSQVRNMGVVEGAPIASDNDWEQIKRGGDEAIRRWIARQMNGTKCCVVLIGAATAGRRWVTHEISTAWNEGKGVVGVHIHSLKDLRGFQSYRGSDPLDHVTFNRSGRTLSTVARTYDASFADSKLAYAHIRQNLANWIDEAIEIRERAE